MNTGFILAQLKNKPKFEVSKYEIIYEGDELVKPSKFNPDGSIDYADTFKDHGKYNNVNGLGMENFIKKDHRIFKACCCY